MGIKDDFLLGEGIYFLNHSIGRPLQSSQQALQDAFMAPWEDGEPGIWPKWLEIIDGFQDALAGLFQAKKEDFCPQTNLSSGLTKLMMALPQLQTHNGIVLMSEIDFPTVGFVLQQALPNGRDQIRYIPKGLDVTDPNVWSDYLTQDVSAVFISHAYSNTGQQAPLDSIVPLAAERNILTMIDVAQSAGVIPLNFSALNPDFVLGTSVKWLCGGPGAGYLWVNPNRIEECEPKDVGWFSHERPFEFDIHDFRYHPTALRFWGGTPSVAPYALAAHSIRYLTAVGIDNIRRHNQAVIEMVAAELGDAFVSPRDEARRNGTMILNFGAQHETISRRLADQQIQIDQRVMGMRVSPHIYNDRADIDRLLDCIN